ncbi:MAG: acetate kinase [Clostridia bacterium]|nr:acetate kinase [Clostridia bacterium]
MKILVINAGSSSLKYQLFNMDNGDVLAKGLCERIGMDGAVTHKRPGKPDYKADVELKDHDDALKIVIDLLVGAETGVVKSIDEIDAVGHRFAHGGNLKGSQIITESVLKYLESIVPINPLHGPPAIAGYKACARLMDGKPQVGVFDTSFYTQIEDFRYIYAIPYEFYEKDNIRRYGFHGTSHRYVSAKAAELLGKPVDQVKVITCHLGNGSSITAVKNGVAIDTTMGFTPQEGVPMGTRSGSIDPTVVTYLMKTKGYSPEEMETILNKKSGFQGIFGNSDCRNVGDAAKAGDPKAILAQKMLGNAVKRYIGSFTAELNGVDAVVFTGGIGEHDSTIRGMALSELENFGIKLDAARNSEVNGTGMISTDDSPIQVWVIPTDEEYMIALDTQKLA